MLSPEVSKRAKQKSGMIGSATIMQELDWMFIRYERILSDMIMCFSEEVYGFNAVYAIDFDVLHACLFPTLQRKSGSIAFSNLAAYVCHSTRERLLIPPGTLSELLDFCTQKWPAISHLDKIFKTNDFHQITATTLSEVYELYRKLEPGEQYILTETKHAIPIIANRLSDYLLGFKRLNSFISKGTVTSFDKVFPEYRTYYDREMLDVLHANIAARRSDYEDQRVNTLKNARDAENLATVMSCDIRYFNDCRKSRNKPKQIIRLLTNTRTLLELKLEEPWCQYPISDIDILPRHIRNREDIWATRALDCAAAACAFREVYETPESCREAALEEYLQVEKKKLRLLQAYRHNEAITTQEEFSDYLASLGFPKWYMCLRNVFSRVNNEYNSLAQAIGKVELEQFDSIRLTDDHIFSKIFLPSDICQKSCEELFHIFRISQSVREIGSTNKVKVFTMVCDVTHEQIICIISRVDGQISIIWENILPINSLIYNLNKVIGNLGSVTGEIYAIYENTDYENGAQTDLILNQRINPRQPKLLAILPIKNNLTISMLIKSADDLLVWPSYLSLHTQIGNMRIDLPVSGAQGGAKVYCRPIETVGINLLLEPLLRATHGWQWVPKLIESFLEHVIATMQNSKE